MFDEAAELRIADLERRINALEAYLYGKAEDRCTKDLELGVQVSKATGRVIPRGKYVGRPHEEVLQKDPGYVCWLADGNLHENFGFTAAEVAGARSIERKKGNRWT